MFTIEIKETRIVRKIVGKVWEKTGQEEKARDIQFYNDKEPKTYLSDTYDYTPEIEKDVAEEREVLKQTVETLDLAAVIKAINKL